MNTPTPNTIFDRPYVLLLTRDQVRDAPDDDIRAAIYAPGLICNFCFEWLQYGLVCQDGLIGRECADRHGYGKAVPWLKMLQAGRCFHTSGEYLTFQRLKRSEGGLLRGLSLLHQLKPQHPFAAGMYKLLMNGKTLTQRQAQTVHQMLTEHGGWKALLAWRDILVRLKHFEQMDVWCMTASGETQIPSIEDTQTVVSLERAAWRFGLSDKQKRLLHVLEDRYHLLRHHFCEDLARSICVMIDNQSQAETTFIHEKNHFDWPRKS